MHTITLKVSDKVYPHLQYLIQNLPEVEIINEDIDFKNRKKYLNNLKNKLDNNELKMYDFNQSIDELLEELES